MIVVDTNVISEAMRTSPNPGVIEWLDAQHPDTLYISTITRAELLFGIERLPNGNRKSALRQMLDQIELRFRGHFLPFGVNTAEKYAEIAALAEVNGRRLPSVDCLIAATAAEHGFAVATRNVRDFEATGLLVIDPWVAR